MALFTPVYVHLYSPPLLLCESAFRSLLSGRASCSSVYFKDLAGPLVDQGIPFPKEDVSVLLRHRNPPYIPDFTFRCVALAVPPFLPQVCLAPLLLRLFNRCFSESSIFDLIPADFISPCFSTLPDSPSACSLQTFDPFPRQNWIYGRSVSYRPEAHRESMQVLKLRRRSSPAGLGSPYASNTPSENLLLGEKLTPTPETRNYGSLQGSKTPQRSKDGVERKHATMSEKKMTSSRRHALKSLILTIAAKWLDEEKAADIAAKEAYMAEHCVKPSMSGDQAALMEACKKLHALLDKLDEERYDLGSKVGKADKEIEDLNIKVVDLRGVKKPALRKVRMSADAMLKALLGSKHSVNMDLRANLKQVKKEVKEEPQEAAGDWRKNVEDKADRKKMFEAT
ncbi:hypothetical protein NQZ68_030550 [Dissostichus eleginoides]|nr:hypothetical protein NQZ68_030550 [Dissostichus eleginoides]